MSIASRNADDVGEVWRNVGLAIGVVTPADNGAVSFDGEAVSCSGGDGNGVGKAEGRGNLSETIIPPAEDGAAGEQGEAEVIAGGNGNGGICWRSGLSERIVPPADNGSVIFQSEAMAESGGDANDVAENWGTGLAKGIITPTGDAGVGQGRGLGDVGVEGIGDCIKGAEAIEVVGIAHQLEIAIGYGGKVDSGDTDPWPVG